MARSSRHLLAVSVWLVYRCSTDPSVGGAVCEAEPADREQNVEIKPSKNDFNTIHRLARAIQFVNAIPIA